MITQQRLKELLRYDRKTGLFTRLVATSPVHRVGETVGTLHRRSGYINFMLDNVNYTASRLAWLYMTGKFPQYDIDHRNGIKSDNSFKNLRDVPIAFNMQNEVRPRKNNASGFMGVWWRKDRARWIATIRVNGRSMRLGSFATKQEANSAYLAAKRIHHPGFTL